jgi:hypothetical protein
VKYLSQLFNQYPWWTFAPDNAHAVVTAGYGTYNGNNGNMYSATYATTEGDGATYSVTYTPVSTMLTVNMTKFSKAVTARWYDPSKGSYQTISGSPFASTGTQSFAHLRVSKLLFSDFPLIDPSLFLNRFVAGD